MIRVPLTQSLAQRTYGIVHYTHHGRSSRPLIDAAERVVRWNRHQSKSIPAEQAEQASLQLPRVAASVFAIGQQHQVRRFAPTLLRSCVLVFLYPHAAEHMHPSP